MTKTVYDLVLGLCPWKSWNCTWFSKKNNDENHLSVMNIIASAEINQLGLSEYPVHHILSTELTNPVQCSLWKSTIYSTELTTQAQHLSWVWVTKSRHPKSIKNKLTLAITTGSTTNMLMKFLEPLGGWKTAPVILNIQEKGRISQPQHDRA